MIERIQFILDGSSGIQIIDAITQMIVSIIVIYLGARQYFDYLPYKSPGRKMVYQEIDWFVHTSLIWTGGFSLSCLFRIIVEGTSELVVCVFQTLTIVACGWIVTKRSEMLKKKSFYNPYSDEEYYLISIVGLFVASFIAVAQGLANLSAVIIFFLGCFFAPDTKSWNIPRRIIRFLSKIQTRNLLIISLLSIFGIIFVVLLSLIANWIAEHCFNLPWIKYVNYMLISCLYCVAEIIFFAMIGSENKREFSLNFNKAINSITNNP